MKYKTLIQKIILYILIAAYVTSFVSTIVISIFLATGKQHLGHNKGPVKPHEDPILGQFGPISTVVLLIGIPLLVLITLGVYVYFLSISKSKKVLGKF